MIQLLYTVLVGEGMMVLLMIVRNPFRNLVILCLDRAKRDHGPVVVKTFAGLMFILLVSSTQSIFKTQRRSAEFGTITPTDQVLVTRLMLEASLMGFSIFLLVVIDRLHHYIRELRLLRKTIEPLKKQNRNYMDRKSAEMSELEREVSALKEKVKQLEAVADAKSEEAKAAEENAMALKNQSDGFLLEYDRLLEDNQNLRTHLQSFERRLSRSDSRRNS
ncbi:hypothetical protein EJ110_NYTH18050 [Nymphaea thermarum]|nr:hypothetical protein EJ110_NYTH18050 [Nymphaea thermarum]